MTIGEVLKTLIAQRNFQRTPSGRSITQNGIDSINASIEDTKNHNVTALKCMNCCIIQSGVLATKGCINCGNIDLTTEIKQGDIL
jgi:hypothetical protein